MREGHWRTKGFFAVQARYQALELKNMPMLCSRAHNERKRK